MKLKSPRQPLEKGQLWKLEKNHLEIVGLGKRLTHYRLLSNLKQKGVPVRMGETTTIETYLRNNGAILIKAGG